MSRLPRIIVTGVAHHVTQRGNKGQRVFLVDDDYVLHKDWLAQSCKSNGGAVFQGKAYLRFPPRGKTRSTLIRRCRSALDGRIHVYEVFRFQPLGGNLGRGYDDGRNKIQNAGNDEGQ